MAARPFAALARRSWTVHRWKFSYRLFGAITQKDYNTVQHYSGGGVSGRNSDYTYEYDVHYIGGEWTSTSSIEAVPSPTKEAECTTIYVTDSNTGQHIASVPRGSETDMIMAIKAAKDALPLWRNFPLSERLKLIRIFLSKFEAKKDDVVDRLTMELGCTTKFARQVQFGSFVVHLKTFMNLLESKTDKDSFEWEYAAGKCTVVKEPVGVVGAITPWNYPLNQIVLKVVPALLAGCTVVLKPSEVTPLVAYSVAEAFEEAAREIEGIPKGIFNMVVGYGAECGQIMASHPDVDLISFTGSTRAGQILTEVASKTMKPVMTELGGKSAAVLLDDADYDKVVPVFVKQLTENTGQSCNALSRMLVVRKDYDLVVDIAKKTFQAERVGISTDPDATMGPLVSKQQYDRVQYHLEKGVEEGARVVVGGPGRPDDSSLPEHGYFVKPTLFADVTNDMTIAREEIFGPVLSMIAYDTEEEAVNIANDTVYGLNNAVASRDITRALKVASQLESGMVMVNGTSIDALAPFGGYKKSGNGREGGKEGIEEFLITKTINIPIQMYRSTIAKVGI
jgi:aldehyde dehydrogenase (NAD+)